VTVSSLCIFLSFLQKYQLNPSANWRSKDAAIYLVTSLATKAKTEKHGITKTNQLVNLGDFCVQNIVPELQATDVNALPILKASCIKYVMTFRSQLPPEMMKGFMSCVVNFLKADSIVVHSYAACSIEKALIMKAGGIGSTQALIQANDVIPLAEKLLQCSQRSPTDL